MNPVKSQRSPAVSVVIPVWNAERYINECLDSVLGSSFSDIEVLCIDDASPDRCGEILDKYADLDVRVRVFHLSENRSQGYARNFGVEQASGTYIYFLDSDDRITPDALSKLFSLAESGRLDAILFDGTYLIEDPSKTGRFSRSAIRRTHRYPGVYRGQNIFSELMENGEWSCYVQRQFLRRSYLVEKEIHFPHWRYHEDEVFAYEAVLRAERVRCIPDRFFIRRIRKGSLMTGPLAPESFYGYLMGIREIKRITDAWICSAGQADQNAGFEEMTEQEESAERVRAASDVNTGRLLNHARREYQILRNNHDLPALFQSREEREVYTFFSACEDAKAFYTRFVSPIVPEVRGRRIYLYGCGEIAEKVWRGLIRENCLIEGFLVSERKPGQSVFLGRPVFGIDEFPGLPEDGIIVLALAEINWPAVLLRLKAGGFSCICYNGETYPPAR